MANTLVGLARLGNCWHSRYHLGPLRVGFWSICGSEPQGIFHSSQMRAAGVDVVSPIEPNSHTGAGILLVRLGACVTLPGRVPRSPAADVGVAGRWNAHKGWSAAGGM